MNARVKLSARQALLGESLTVLPTLALIMVLTIVFSVGTAAVGLLPGDATLAQALTALLTLPAALLTIAPLRLRLQQKHIILALGSRDGRELHFTDGLNACVLYSALFALKLLWLLLFEAIPAAFFTVFALRIARQPVSLKASAALLIGSAALAAAGLLFWGIAVQRYARAGFYLAAYGDISPVQAISMSVKRCREELTELFLFKLSFLPWLLRGDIAGAVCHSVLQTKRHLSLPRRQVTAAYILILNTAFLIFPSCSLMHGRCASSGVRNAKYPASRAIEVHSHFLTGKNSISGV